MREIWTHDRPYGGAKINKEYLGEYDFTLLYLFNNGQANDLSNFGNRGSYVNPARNRREYRGESGKSINIPYSIYLNRDPFTIICRLKLDTLYIAGYSENIYEMTDSVGGNILRLAYNFNTTGFTLEFTDWGDLNSGAIETNKWPGALNRQFMITYRYDSVSMHNYINDKFNQSWFLSFESLPIDPLAQITFGKGMENIAVDEFIFCKRALEDYQISRIYREPYHYLEY